MGKKKIVPWKDKPDITESVFAYSKDFVSRYKNSERVFDYSEASLLKEVVYEIDNYDNWDLAEGDARVYWAQVLAYFSATLCTLFDGVCIGEFDKMNPGWSYYTFRIKFDTKILNPEDVIGRACDKQFDFSEWYFNIKSKLYNNKT
jgi:hypothetical protein